MSVEKRSDLTKGVNKGERTDKGSVVCLCSRVGMYVICYKGWRVGSCL